MSRENGLSTAVKIALLTLAALGSDVPVRGQAVGFVPIPAPLPSGVMLDVTPAVSADRRYVRMSLGVNFNEIIGFTPYQVPAAVSGGGAGMNGPIGGLGGILGGGGGGGGGGRGAGGGSVSMGPIAPVMDPDLGYFSPAGDPFEQALNAPPAPVARAPTLPAPSGKSPLRSRSGQGKAGRTRRRPSSGPQSAPIPRTSTVTPNAESSETTKTRAQSGVPPLDL
jgi:hypothetical protein